MSNDDYKPGNPEYDYWNDKNLYPSLRHEGDEGYEHDAPHHSPRSFNAPEDTKIGAGAVFVVMLGWMFIFAPFALFLSWKHWLVQIIFWGGIVLTVLTFILWLCGAIQEYYQDKNSSR